MPSSEERPPTPPFSPLAELEKYKRKHPELFKPQSPEESFEILIDDTKPSAPKPPQK